jgi:hypothetical protein
MRGAEVYLLRATKAPCSLLLNGNSQMTGPWLDSLEWLANLWVPQASRLGLRYVAHVVQADRHHDELTSRMLENLPFELQIFNEVADACHWLAQVRPLLK